LRATQPDNEPVDPATQQNHWGSSGRDIDEFILLWKFGTCGWAALSGDCRCGPAGDHIHQGERNCHRNKKAHTLTTATITIEL